MFKKMLFFASILILFPFDSIAKIKTPPLYINIEMKKHNYYVIKSYMIIIMVIQFLN
jgi:hypothetical protein